MADSPGLSGPEPVNPPPASRRESWLRRPDPKTAEQEFARLRALLAAQIERDEVREARQTAAAMICLKPDDADALEVFTYLDQAITQLEGPPPAPAPEPAREIRCITAHANEILAVAVSPDGRFVMSAAGDSPANPGTPANPGAPPAGDELGFRLWDVATGKEVRRLRGHTSVTTSLVYASGGRHVLSGNRGGTLGLWEVETGRLTQRFKGRVKFVTAVALSPDGRSALSGSDDNVIRLWDTDRGDRIRKFEGHAKPITSLAFSPDGRRFLSASQDHTLRLWETDNGRLVRRFKGHETLVWSAAFTPDGRRALSASGCGFFSPEKGQVALDCTIRLWDADTAKEIRRFKGHTDVVHSAAVSADGKLVLSGSEDKTVRLWDIATGEERSRLEGHARGVRSVAFIPNSRLVVSGSLDGTIRVWQLPG